METTSIHRVFSSLPPFLCCCIQIVVVVPYSVYTTVCTHQLTVTATLQTPTCNPRWQKRHREGKQKQTFTNICIPDNTDFYSHTMAGQLVTAIVVTFRLSKPLALFCVWTHSSVPRRSHLSWRQKAAVPPRDAFLWLGETFALYVCLHVYAISSKVVSYPHACSQQPRGAHIYCRPCWTNMVGTYNT